MSVAALPCLLTQMLNKRSSHARYGTGQLMATRGSVAVSATGATFKVEIFLKNVFQLFCF